MSSSPASSLVLPYRCRDCGSEVGFRSRRRNLLERYLLPLLLMRPVRCSDCFRRDYRLIFTDVRERRSNVARILPVEESSTPKRYVA